MSPSDAISPVSAFIVHAHLASKQIEPLDAVRTFVDRVEPVVAIELFDLVLACVAVAAMLLDGQVVGRKAPL